MSQPTSKRGAILALLAAFLGWLFDGMEMGIFPIVAHDALQEMGASVPDWMARITAGFLVGAALGGVVFGWLGDKVGRVRAMTWSILCYSVFSGLCYFATSPWHLAGCRFLAALGMGGEWALGVALVMEIWPSDKRPLMAACIGAAANLGYCLIAGISIFFHITNWRIIMAIGAAPALITFGIRLFVPESEKWQAAQATTQQKQSPLQQIFAPQQRRNTILGICYAGIALLVTWGAVQWIPLWAKELAPDPALHAKDQGQFWQALGAACGCLISPFLGHLVGRRLAYALLCGFGLLACQIFYRCIDSYGFSYLATAYCVGLCTGSLYGWLPLYLPELFPTRCRATGQGLAFNFGRLIAAFGALYVPVLKNYFGGYAGTGAAVSLLYILGICLIWLGPETKGKPLPE
jgi:MFS transporter, SHS family, sialic acid transporter